MSCDQLPSGSYDARQMANGVRYTAALPTREDAERRSDEVGPRRRRGR